MEAATELDVAALVEGARREGAESMRNLCLVLLEGRRLQVLRDPADPSWTEHFADLQNQVRGIEV
jgi:hypothetical protein